MYVFSSHFFFFSLSFSSYIYQEKARRGEKKEILIFKKTKKLYCLRLLKWKKKILSFVIVIVVVFVDDAHAEGDDGDVADAVGAVLGFSFHGLVFLFLHRCYKLS